MRTRLTASATLVAAGLLLTACGGGPLDDKTGPEVAAAAADAIEAAGSFHLSGAIARDGQDSEIDLHVQGEDAVGTMDVEGAEVELVCVDGAVYVQASRQFWTAFGIPDGSVAALENRWVSLPRAPSASFQQFSLAHVVGELRGPDGYTDDGVTSTEVDGDDAVVVQHEDGTSLTVLDDEPSYPVELTTGEGAWSGQLTISRFGEEEDITAPTDALDLTELMGGA